MEKLVTIREQLPLSERQYNDRNGQPQVYASVGFVLSDGIDTFYAEMAGERARALGTLDKDRAYRVQCVMKERQYADREGVVRHATDIQLINIG